MTLTDIKNTLLYFHPDIAWDCCALPVLMWLCGPLKSPLVIHAMRMHAVVHAHTYLCLPPSAAFPSP